MKIIELDIAGAYLIEREEFKDERGSFSRQFCINEMKEYGINFDIKQCNVSKNKHRGVLRGMHYQKYPYPEIKMVSCLKGGVYDVIVDIRPNSKSYLKWIGTELTEENNKMLYIPAGVAHGFQSLTDDSVVYYQLGEFFFFFFYSGIRWDDPKLNIYWPACERRIINERDKSYELL